jgi:outer membrane protein TolC
MDLLWNRESAGAGVRRESASVVRRHLATLFGTGLGGQTMRSPGSTGSVLVFAFVLSAGIAHAEPASTPTDSGWTLKRCQDAARNVSPALAASRATAAAARAGADAAATGYLPTVGLSGRGSYVTETMHLDVPTPTGSRSVEFGDGSDVNFLLGLRAPLYQGGSLRAEHRAAEERWRASLADVASDSLDLQLQVREAFFAALGAQAAAAAAHQGEARLRRHLKEVEQNLDAGTATKEARLQVLARLRRTEQSTTAAEAEATSRRFALGRLVGRPGEQIRPQADLTTSLLDGDETQRPWNQRPPLQAVEARQGAVDQTAKSAQGSMLPAVDLEAGWNYGRPGIDRLTNEWMDYGTVALNLRWTLFDFGRRGDRVAGLRAQSRALSARKQQVQEALQTLQADARAQLDAARTEASQGADRVDLEQQRLEMARQRWRQGHASENELLDAEDDVTLATSDLATSQARLRLAEARLLAAWGW